MTLQEGDQPPVRGKEVVNRLLVLRYGFVIGGCELFLEEEGVGVPIMYRLVSSRYRGGERTVGKDWAYINTGLNSPRRC